MGRDDVDVRPPNVLRVERDFLTGEVIVRLSVASARQLVRWADERVIHGYEVSVSVDVEGRRGDS